MVWREEDSDMRKPMILPHLGAKTSEILSMMSVSQRRGQHLDARKTLISRHRDQCGDIRDLVVFHWCREDFDARVSLISVSINQTHARPGNTLVYEVGYLLLELLD